MAAQPNEVANMGPLRSVRRENMLAELATRQHGVVAIVQMHELGWTTSAISARQAAGKLHRLYRGVYAVGHRRLTRPGSLLAAVLACGPEAALSHRSAGELRGWRRRFWPIEVSVPRPVRKRHGVSVRVAGDLDLDRTIVDGIPCASVALTLLGIAEVEPAALGDAIAAAERHRQLDLRELDALLERRRGRPGTAALRSGLAEIRLEDQWSRSGFERRFLRLCADAGLPRPRLNAWIEVPSDGFEVDFSWPDARLVVEADSYEWHADRAAFERDRRRDQLLAAAGWRVLRVTWRQLTGEPHRVVEAVRRIVSG